MSPLWTALLAPLMWGTTYAVTQRWLPQADPVWLAGLRILIPGVLLLPLVPRSVWQQRWRDVLILSVLNLGLFTFLLFTAIQRLPGGMAATLVSTVPLQVLLLRWLMGHFPGIPRLLAAMVGIAGVAMLVWQAPQQPDWLGVVAALLAAHSMAWGIMLVPKLGQGIAALPLTAAQLVVSGVLLTAIAVFLGLPFPEVTLSSSLTMVWLGPISVGLGYFVWFRAMETVAVEKLAFLGLVNPIVAVMAGVMLMSEQLQSLQWLGMTLVLASVLLAQRLPASLPVAGSLKPAQ
ncbi:EamA family transporter [Bacterioplanes sanyensis]|uniref:EamA family transporter n=1 Tax=Bacterioplanes sanyensis TaxID=1249553 RepID=A0A222FQE1_9GAMM|nr:EamA family transporter [Bacterioplanes sanyensis]ASP40453.1 EamA family transporter [Bacterioplanes sanyensis]